MSIRDGQPWNITPFWGWVIIIVMLTMLVIKEQIREAPQLLKASDIEQINRDIIDQYNEGKEKPW